MLAEVADKPFDNGEWLFELKYDGYRALANIQNNKVDLYSRNFISFNESYPSIVSELKKLHHTAILDGEVVAEKRGRSEFQLLQNTGTGKVKLKYYVFDLLHLNGYDLFEVPLRNRKELLKMLLKSFSFENIHYSEHVDAKGISFYNTAIRKRQEGIIAKDGNSPYRVGRRTKEWLKIKIQQQQEMIIVGFTAPKRSREFFGSLVLAVYEDGKLKYAGNCGTGFTVKELGFLYNKAKPLFTNERPFKEKINPYGKVQWIKPRLVCQVRFTEWTKENHLRHPVYLGLRKEKSASEVVREKPTVKIMKKENKVVKKNAVVKKATKSSSRKTAVKKPAKTSKPKVKEEKSDGKKEYDLRIGKTTLHLTNQDKIFWPKEKYTKGDVVNYYNAVAEFILPYLKDRPQSMNRFPNGIKGPSFYQKDVDPKKIPSWLKTKKIYSSSNQENIDYLICNDKATLVYMANLGCIEINPWNSRISNVENPDWVVIDLDPEEIGFKEVVRAAMVVKETLDDLEIESYPKTSGATGMHIYIPLAAKYNYETAKTFAQLIAHLANEKLPDTTSIIRSPSQRKKKVYLDFLQNSRGQTLAAPYSIRPRPGATVSTPLEWKEVNDKLDPTKFTIKTTLERLDKKGDLWKPILGRGENIGKVLKKLQAQMEKE